MKTGRKKILKMLSACVIIAILCFGCGQDAGLSMHESDIGSKAVTFTDNLGREVTVDFDIPLAADAVNLGGTKVLSLRASVALYTLKPNNRWGEAYEKLEKILSE